MNFEGSFSCFKYLSISVGKIEDCTILKQLILLGCIKTVMFSGKKQVKGGQW